MKKILSIVAIAFAFCLVNTSYSYARYSAADAIREELKHAKDKKKAAKIAKRVVRQEVKAQKKIQEVEDLIKKLEAKEAQ